MHPTAGEQPADNPEAGMVDVSEILLEQLAKSTDTILAHAIRRRLAESEDPAEPIAGWNSASP